MTNTISPSQYEALPPGEKKYWKEEVVNWDPRVLENGAFGYTPEIGYIPVMIELREAIGVINEAIAQVDDWYKYCKKEDECTIELFGDCLTEALTKLNQLNQNTK
jgi:hypothetical protein